LLIYSAPENVLAAGIQIITAAKTFSGALVSKRFIWITIDPEAAQKAVNAFIASASLPVQQQVILQVKQVLIDIG
jgi:hypothetical protein